MSFQVSGLVTAKWQVQERASQYYIRRKGIMTILQAMKKLVLEQKIIRLDKKAAV